MGKRLVINLLQLKYIYTTQSLQNQRIAKSEIFVVRGRSLCKLDLKDANYCVPFRKNLRKCVRFRWSGNLCEFLCLYFGLDPAAPRIFTKLLKIPIAILRCTNVRMIIYLDDMLLMGYSIKEISMCHETVIFLLQHLGFAINSKKSVLTALPETKFLGLKFDSVNLEISLREEKTENKSKMSIFFL